MTKDIGARSVDEWERDLAPVESAVSAIREMAEHGNTRAKAFVGIVDAMKAKKHAERWGEEVPAWAREALSFLDEYQSDTDEESAVAALTAALA
jgi:hypothetical protein